MITAELCLNSGALKELRVQGHADRENNGQSIPCAGVSLLVKAVGLAVMERKLLAEGRAKEEGDFFLRVRPDADQHQWLCGLSTLLRKGLQAVVDEYPDKIRLIVQEVHNGT